MKKPKEPKATRVSRRGFVSGLTALGGAAWSGSGLLAAGAEAPALDEPAGRLGRAFDVRLAAARRTQELGLAEAPTNGDEQAYPDRLASYTKGLPHDHLGHVDAAAYEVLERALASGSPEDFESIPLGGPAHLANPQAALAFDLVGPDGCQLGIRPPPRLASEAQASEMIELYWRALLRDVPFADYGSHPLVEAAAQELSSLSAFDGPKDGDRVTAGTLFRGATAGDRTGPFVSQFLWKPIPWSPLRVEQTIRTAAPALDYLTQYPEWLAIQNGTIAGVNRFDPRPRYIRNGRDLGEYVHRDFTYQAFLGACLAALKMGTPADGGSPYKHSHTQSGFATFGPPYLLYLLAVVTQVALKACWFQKWLVHRRLRPEALGGRLENHLLGKASYPLHPGLLESTALSEARRRWRSALLPQAYPEGSPLHPSYPAGHAVIAGACVTALKACLDETHEIPDPVEASADGLTLHPYRGPDLTVGGELDKLAANIAFGRDFAGVHYRSDGSAGLELGESVTIAVLDEMRLTGNELFTGYSLRRFDGSRTSVG